MSQEKISLITTAEEMDASVIEYSNMFNFERNKKMQINSNKIYPLNEETFNELLKERRDVKRKYAVLRDLISTSMTQEIFDKCNINMLICWNLGNWEKYLNQSNFKSTMIPSILNTGHVDKFMTLIINNLHMCSFELLNYIYSTGKLTQFIKPTINDIDEIINFEIFKPVSTNIRIFRT